MIQTYTAGQYNTLKKQKAYAWAQYYNYQRDEVKTNIERIERIERMPNFVKEEIIELYTELKKSVECPVCLETLAPNQLQFSSCGHKYCMNCLPRVKERGNCAVCRKKLY